MDGLPASVQQDSVRRRKSKIVPFDIDQFLIAMATFENEVLGAYMRVLVHYWLNGFLPENSERLAKIMRIDSENSDTPSITRSITRSIESIEQQRSEWLAKRKKAHDKAVKAVNTRWARYRQMKSEKSGTPSTTPSTKKERFSHTLSKETIPSGGEQSVVKNTPSFPQPPMGETIAKEEVKAKPVRIDRLGAAGTREDVTIHNGPAASTYPAKNASAGHFKQNVNPEFDPLERDGRFRGFYEELSRYWDGLNPGGPGMPWIRPDRRALNDLLAGNPDLHVATFRSMLEHRAGSENVNPLEPPRAWLRNAVKFAGSPLDRYGKPRKPPRRY